MAYRSAVSLLRLGQGRETDIAIGRELFQPAGKRSNWSRAERTAWTPSMTWGRAHALREGAPEAEPSDPTAAGPARR
jgi:hypothetical protein